MSRIGILTYHRNFNYGAFMQCYALSHRLAIDFPDDIVEVVDYSSKRMYENYTCVPINYVFGFKNAHNPLRLQLRRCAKIVLGQAQLRKKRILHDAFEKDLKHLPLSKERLVSDDVVEFTEFIQNKYDAIIVGSDGVWEFISYGFPNAFFLNADIGAKRLSYAASSDRMHISKISDVERSYLRESFEKFDYIGIRDIATENLIKKISPELHIHHNCDPTLLLTMSQLEEFKASVKEKLLGARIDLNRPIIGVMGEDEIAKEVKKHFGEKYQIVSVYDYCKHSDAYLNDLTPCEWSVVFSFFCITFTKYFHGTILSLKNSTPTITIDGRWMEDDTHITKLRDFYNRVGLLQHYCRREEFLDATKQKAVFERAEYFIGNNDQIAIKAALDREAEAYNGFRKKLGGIVHGRQTEN